MLSLGPCLANGLARFSYALLLPAMRADLGWSYAQAGWLSTANALGYLLGALFTLALSNTVRAGALYRGGMVVTTGALLMTGLWTSLPGLSIARIAAGVGAAPVFISGGVLAAQLARGDKREAALAITVYFGGSGLGIMASGALIPWFLQAYGAEVWPQSWLALAVAGAACAALSWRRARSATTDTAGPSHWRVRSFAPTLLSYFLFAAGYMVYMTFLIAWLREARASVLMQAMVWMSLGVGVCLCPVVWRSVVDRLPRNAALAAACAGTGCGALLALNATSAGALFASSTVFGLSFFAAPVAVMAFVRRSAPQCEWNRLVALHTVAFALGQIVGPVLAGAVADATGSLQGAMWLAVALLLAGTAVALLQRDIDRSEAQPSLDDVAGARIG